MHLRDKEMGEEKQGGVCSGQQVCQFLVFVRWGRPGQGLHPGSAGVCSAHPSVKWPGTGADNKPGMPYNGSSRGPPL